MTASAPELKVEVLELKKGKYKIIRVGNVRFDCLVKCDEDPSKETWAGLIEGEKEDTPIFCSKHEGFTVEQIQKCANATAEFLKALDREEKKKEKKSS